jgi:lipopolysaccharide export system protein LptA
MTSLATSLRTTSIAIAFAALAAGEAQPAPDLSRGPDLGADSGKPIAVNADNFLADLKGETGTYTGNVIVEQGEVKLHADQVTVRAPGGKASRMEAKGHVVVDSPSGQAVGDNGIYDVAAQNLRLTGHVVLTQEANVMRGSELLVSMDTGIATLSAGPQNPGEAPGRVQGLFVPAQKPDAAAAPKPSSPNP